jgi:SIR2-like domain
VTARVLPSAGRRGHLVSFPNVTSDSALPDAARDIPALTPKGQVGTKATHDPREAIGLLVEKLGQPRRHLSLLLGAGASMAAGLPDLAGLAGRVSEVLDPPQAKEFGRLASGRNLEEVLSYVRAARSLLAVGGGTYDGLTADSAAAFDRAVTRGIAQVIGTVTPSSTAHGRLAAWLGRSLRPSPTEVFTTNYDLLIEQALDARGVPYFDGFVGLYRGEFRPDLIEPDESSDRERPPSGWVRLWKLHGSVSWVLDAESKHISRLAAPAPPDSMLAIYPSAEKYEQSRRMPFLALTDRLRRALATPESTTVIIGYSFGDAHLNELIFDAAARHQRSEIIALFYDKIPDSVRTAAGTFANLTAYGANEAILSGVEAPYASADPSPGWDGSASKVGDFSELVHLLPFAESPPSNELSDAQRPIAN